MQYLLSDSTVLVVKRKFEKTILETANKDSWEAFIYLYLSRTSSSMINIPQFVVTLCCVTDVASIYRY